MEADSEYRTRRVVLEARAKSTITPKRSLNLKANDSESRLITTPVVRGINEVYANLNATILDELDHDKNKQLAFCNKLHTGLSRISGEEISMFIFNFHNEGKSPSKKHVEYMASLITGSQLNDVIVPPLLSGIGGEQYVDYLKEFFESLKSYTDNPQVMGSIPFATRFDVQQICDFYKDNDVRQFALDLCGKNARDQFVNINEVHRTMRSIEKELTGEECCYLHGLNVRRPRALEKKGVAPARDIIVYEMGFNSFGSSHIQLKMSADQWEKIVPRKFAWIFRRADYGYYPFSDNHHMPAEADESATFKLSDIRKSTIAEVKNVAKMYNVERQGLEAYELQMRLKTNELGEYLKEKTVAAESLKEVKELFSHSDAS